MSASNEWTEYHLTPLGWVAGSEKMDFSGIESVEPPEDRLLTVVQHEYLSSSFSKMERWSDITWKSDDAPQIAELQERFGKLPNEVGYPLR